MAELDRTRDYQADDLRIITWVEAVFRHPKMYTLTGTLEETFCVLFGYYWGLERGLASHPNREAGPIKAVQDEWTHFFDWLCERFPEVEAKQWMDIIDALRSKVLDDKELLHCLASMYEEYRSCKP